MKKILLILSVVVLLGGCEMYNGTYIRYDAFCEDAFFDVYYLTGSGETIHETIYNYKSINMFIPPGLGVGITASNSNTREDIKIRVFFETKNGTRTYKIESGQRPEIHGVIRF